ncbi:hypothetical protein ANTHELSMS3_05085 (plasmid) [Antarctobacter heliothermus]|uniref:Uncharacterized protein n=2 Tax=Antarctobacter heliothermus TaxID=74033 RepID=A0A222EBA0_9RHOB|nr:hypothetical protein ANTHELSMS3_05085 [Antarctobacter heliothermus]MBT56243.1 hypothetical protein [Mameliella sp.]
MLRFCMLGATLLTMSAGLAFAHDTEALKESPPGDPYVQVSDVLPLPEFLPGLGTLFVVPDTLPAGPFLAYDHDGKLSATVYMTPLEALSNGTAYNDLHVGLHEVTSVDVYYNAGHPGVDEPHAHIVLYHDADAKGRLAQ